MDDEERERDTPSVIFLCSLMGAAVLLAGCAWLVVLVLRLGA